MKRCDGKCFAMLADGLKKAGCVNVILDSVASTTTPDGKFGREVLPIWFTKAKLNKDGTPSTKRVKSHAIGDFCPLCGGRL